MTTGVTVDFNANLARFTSAIDKATNDLSKFQTNAQRTSANISKTFNMLGAGLSVGAVVTWTKSLIDAADEMQDLSQRVGVNIKNLATWELAAKQSGTSLESLAKGIKGLSGFIIENGAALKKAGIDATDANGALIQLADLFQAMPDGVEKTALAVKLFGKSGMEMIPMLNQGSKGLQEAADKSKNYAEKLAALAPNADKFNDEMAELALQSKAAGMNIVDYFIPGLIGIATLLNDLRAGGTRAESAMQWLSDKSPLYKGLVEWNKFANTALALAGIGGGSGSRSASGKIGDDWAAFDAATAAYMKGFEARKKALALLGPKKEDKAESTADLDRMLKLGQKNLFDSLDSEEDARMVAHKRELDDARKFYDDLNRMLKVGEANQMAAIDSEEEMRELALKREIDSMKEKTKEAESFAREMGMSFSSAFEDAVIGGKKFSEVLKGLSADIARIIIRKSITEPLGGAISGLVKGFNFSDLFKAEGGPVSGGQSYIVGERGPEIFTPMSSGNITPNSKVGGNVFNVDMRGASVEAVARLEQLVMSINGSIERRAFNVMAQARVRG